MNFSFILFFGIIILGVGLIWLLIPHAFHERVADSSTHFSHTVAGFVISLFGVLILLWDERKISLKR